jgi:hypothetical protein
MNKTEANNTVDSKSNNIILIFTLIIYQTTNLMKLYCVPSREDVAKILNIASCTEFFSSVFSQQLYFLDLSQTVFPQIGCMKVTRKIFFITIQYYIRG